MPFIYDWYFNIVYIRNVYLTTSKENINRTGACVTYQRSAPASRGNGWLSQRDGTGNGSRCTCDVVGVGGGRQGNSGFITLSSNQLTLLSAFDLLSAPHHTSYYLITNHLLQNSSILFKLTTGNYCNVLSRLHSSLLLLWPA